MGKMKELAMLNEEFLAYTVGVEFLALNSCPDAFLRLVQSHMHAQTESFNDDFGVECKDVYADLKTTGKGSLKLVNLSVTFSVQRSCPSKALAEVIKSIQVQHKTLENDLSQTFQSSVMVSVNVQTA